MVDQKTGVSPLLWLFVLNLLIVGAVCVPEFSFTIEEVDFIDTVPSSVRSFS